jgi:hypothetical protein
MMLVSINYFQKPAVSTYYAASIQLLVCSDWVVAVAVHVAGAIASGTPGTCFQIEIHVDSSPGHLTLTY